MILDWGVARAEVKYDVSAKPYLKSIPSIPDFRGVTEDPKVVAQNAINNKCKEFKEKLDNHVNPLPLVDWLNVSNLPDFFQPTIQGLIKQEDYFNKVDSLGCYNLALQPYGFYSNYKIEKDDFKLGTLGITIDGGMSFQDRWILGGGIGYWHSNLDWGKDEKDNRVNSLYFGPYAGAIFERGYVGLTLLGVYNMYDINHLLVTEDKGQLEHTGWDASARLKGAIDFEWPKRFGPHFYIQPKVDLSYLLVFQNSIEETGKVKHVEEEVTAKIDTRIYQFFRSALDVELRKEFKPVKEWLIIPSLSLGWVLMQPLSRSEIEASFSSKMECSESFDKPIKGTAYRSSHQWHLGAQVIAVAKRGWLVSLGGDAYLADTYPAYSGNLRFEWSW